MSLTFAQRGPRAPPNPAQIQKMLDENGHLIQTIQEYQNKGKAQDCLQYQQILHRNLVYLASIADANQNIQALLPVSTPIFSSNFLYFDSNDRLFYYTKILEFCGYGYFFDYIYSPSDIARILLAIYELNNLFLVKFYLCIIWREIFFFVNCPDRNFLSQLILSSPASVMDCHQRITYFLTDVISEILA